MSTEELRVIYFKNEFKNVSVLELLSLKVIGLIMPTSSSLAFKQVTRNASSTEMNKYVVNNSNISIVNYYNCSMKFCG